MPLFPAAIALKKKRRYGCALVKFVIDLYHNGNSDIFTENCHYSHCNPSLPEIKCQVNPFPLFFAAQNVNIC